jgi:DNA-binding PadR family transcriptional regulator
MGCDIVPRDVFAFRELSSGPAVFQTVRSWMREHGTIKDPAGIVRNRASNISPGAVRKRLHRLSKDGWIQSRCYGNGGALYALTEKSQNYLVKFEKMDPSHIRAYLPSPRMVSHELEVTEVVRRLKKDALMLHAELKIADERKLRSCKMAQLKPASRMSNPEDVFPDLHVLFSYYQNDERTNKHFSMDIDNATIPAEKVAMKLERVTELWKWPPVLLCTLQCRIDDISRAILERGGDELGNGILLALLSEYCHYGLADTQWKLATGEQMPLTKV